METFLSEQSIAILIAGLGVLTGLNNIIVELIKKVTLGKVPTNLVAFICGEVLTIPSVIAYCQLSKIGINWIIIFAAIIGGAVVSLLSMVGWDKVKEIFDFKNHKVSE